MASTSIPSHNTKKTQGGGKAANIPREQWECHKETIRQLYVERKLQMKDLMSTMEKDHAFKATDSQYWPKLREWGFAKNKRARAPEPGYPQEQRRPAAPGRSNQSQALGGNALIDSVNMQNASTFQPESEIPHDGGSSTSHQTPDPDVHLDGGFESAVPSALPQGTNAPAQVEISESDNPPRTFQNSDSINASAGPADRRTNTSSINLGLPSQFSSLPSRNPSAYSMGFNGQMSGSMLRLPSVEFDDGVDLFNVTGNHIDLSGGSIPQLGWSQPFMNFGTSLPQSQVQFGHFPPSQYNQHYATQPQGLQQQRPTQSGAYGKHFQSAAAPLFEINNYPYSSSARRAEPLNNSGLGSSLKLRQPIHQAAQARSFRGIQVLLSADPSCASVLGLDGVSAVAIAAQNGDLNIVQLLIDHLEIPAGLEMANFDSGRTALHQAAQGGHFEVVKLLLEKGVNSDPKDHTNVTPLWCAAQQGFQKIVKLLLANNADPNISSYDGGRRPIHQAAQNGHADVVKLLLDEGAEPDEEDSSNITPVWSACQQGYHTIVKMLLSTTTTQFNVEVASKDGGRRPIHQAAQNGHVKVVEALLEYGAKGDPEVDTYDDKVPSPLWLAAQNGSIEVAKLLIKKKANPDFAINPSRRRALHQAAQSGHIDIVHLLIECRADLNSGEEDGWPPMMIAAQEGHLQIVKLLIDGGADVDAEEKDGATSLWIASQQGHTDIVKLLLENGAKSLSTKSASRRPIHQAAQNGHLDVVKLLVEHDPEEVDVEEKKGFRPLTFAAQKSDETYLEMMKFLLEKGAKPTNE